MVSRIMQLRIRRSRRFQLRALALTLVAGILAIGTVVLPANAAVTVQGSFVGYSVADVKGYAFNTSAVTSTMTTVTPFDTDGNTSIKLMRNGAGSPLMNFTPNGSSVNCWNGCPYGDPSLNGFTFSMRDASNNAISLSDAIFFIFDTSVTVEFSGANPVTVLPGSTIKFEFAPNTVLGADTMTDQIMTWDVNNLQALDQTPVYSWFKRVLFYNAVTNTKLTALAYGGADFVLASDSSATSTLPAANYLGYTFSGWNTVRGGTGTAYAAGSTFSYPASTTTLYAQFTPNLPTVTFNANGGSGSLTSQSSASAANLTSNTTQITRTGYTFSGWNTVGNGSGTAYANGASFPFSSSTTLYAQWAGISNTVTYDVDGGSSVASGSFTTGGTLTLPNAPTKSGYQFGGWFESPTGGTAVSSGYSPAATGPITLYARWALAARVVTFDANGGLGTMTSQSSGSAASLTANAFSRNGYYFDGWNTAANGSGTDFANSASYDFVANATLYAKWRSIPLAPTASVAIQVPVGQPIANAPVALAADGLKDQTGYTVTVHSTPQIIDQGTIWSGRLNTTVRIPSNLEAGWHRLVIEGTAADGTPWTETSYFQVSASGLLAATSDSVPAELAYTGQNPDAVTSVATLSGALLLLGLGFMGVGVTLRRRRSQ